MGSNTNTNTNAAGSPTTYRTAVVQDRYGGPEVFVPGEVVERPVLGATDVLIEMRAAGLDRGTWHLMTGLPLAARPVIGWRRPRSRIPGLDVAGVVVEVGSRVTRVAVGDEVHGIGRGSFADLVVADEAKLSPKPSRLTFEQAAPVAVSAATALQAVADAGGVGGSGLGGGSVRAGRRVLITGASGGVGTYAVQFAVALGADVTGVCSGPKADLVLGLGASDVVDHRAGDLVDTLVARAARFDVVIDIAGNTPLRRMRRVLAERGTLVIVGGEGDGRLMAGTDRQLRALLWSPFLRQRLCAVVASEHHDVLDRVDEFIEAGSVTPVVDRVYPLAEVREAMGRLVRGEARGKIVLVP